MSLRTPALTLGLLAPVAACTTLLGVTDVPAGPDASAGPDATNGHDAGAADGAPMDATNADAGTGDASTGDAASDAGIADSGHTDSCVADGCAPSYVQVVLDDQPLAYWRLGDMSGSNAADTSGHNHQGTYVGNVLYQQMGAIPSDPSSRSVYLNEGSTSNGYVSAAGAPFNFPGQASFSLEAWVQPTVIDTSYRGVVSDEIPSGTTKVGYVVYLGGFTDGGVGIGYDRYGDSGSTPLHDAGAVLQGAGWFHIVAVYDGSSTSTMSLYVNGGLSASSPTTRQIQPFSCQFDIGATLCGANGWFQGYIAEVAVYGTALSAAQVQNHYAAAQ
jgi:hypothetical protein